MKKLSSIWFAVIIGFVCEGVLCALYPKFMSFGPCGPGNTYSAIMFWLHHPALELDEALSPQNPLFDWIILIGGTGVLNCAAAFPFVVLVRQIWRRKLQFGLATPMAAIAACAVVFWLLRLR